MSDERRERLHCPVCGDNHDEMVCREAPDVDERRERYVAAINEADGWVNDGGVHRANAAMSVADEEIHDAAYRENAKGGEARGVVGQIRHDLGVKVTGNPWSPENMQAAAVAVREMQAANARLRAELAWANQRLSLADESAKERACLTPGYTEGPCHCVHCDPASIDRDNARLRAELEEADESNRLRRIELFEARATIERMRAVLHSSYVTHDIEGYACVRVVDLKRKLDGEN
jgi:hypothetical protein